MLGINWFRIGAVVALFLGSIYVVLPTFLQDDLESRLAAQASGIETPTSQRVDLDMHFAVEGDAAAAAAALKSRLEGAAVPFERVQVDDAGNVEVLLGVGADKAVVEGLASRRGEIALFDPRPIVVPVAPPGPEGSGSEVAVPPDVLALVQASGVDAAAWGPALAPLGQAMASTNEPALAVSLGGVTRGADGAVRATLTTPLPEGVPFALLAIDGRWAGIVAREGAVAWLPGAGASGPVYDEHAATLLAHPALPAPLTRIPEDAAPAEDQAAPVAATESRVPTWLLALLPDTRMNLGLDLQGGIDLTLQVGLEDAVLAQATRDIAYLKAQATKDGFPIDAVRRERFTPLVWITTASEIGDLQKFCRRVMPDYVYASSDGNQHAFEMNQDRQDSVKSQAVEQVLETLRKRVDATGVKEPSIVKKGGGRINVQLPGEVDLQSAIDAIGTAAVLEFRMVDEEFDDAVLERIVQAAKDALPPDQFQDDGILNDWLWETKRLAEDRVILWEYAETADGKERSIPYPLNNDVLLTGQDVSNAGVGWDQNQQPFVSLDFRPRGGQIFCDVTSTHVGKRFGIILDDKVMSAPSIRERICGGSARIDMGSATDPLKESQSLALVLRTGSLDAPVDVGEVRTVGSTLGKDAIRDGGWAAVIGVLLVVVFMTAWYGWAGVLANVALALNLLLIFASLCLFGATLTLPGIAGIALTAGMAVDANIIIFERIREELKLGIHPRKAVDVGFQMGLAAVLDANITTAIAGIVLFSYGTGAIKGFAVTLLVGIATTLVTALFVTRTLMDLTTRSSTARLNI